MPSRNPKISAQNADRLGAMGAQIRHERKRLELSVTVAAEAAGMSRVTWHRIEKGEAAVTIGAWLSAATALGLVLDIPGKMSAAAGLPDVIPTRVRQADYPELRKLAWHVRDDESLSAREAFDIYQRNERHLDAEAMTVEERQLLDGLRQAFGGGSGDG